MAQKQELRPKDPSAMLPVSPTLKEALNKFEQDFKALNLKREIYYLSPSTAKWYKLGNPSFEEKMQELNTDFASICISPNLLEPLWVKFPFSLSTRPGKISVPSTFRLHSIRFLLSATSLWKVAGTALRLLLNGSKLKYKKVLTLKGQPEMVMRRPMTT